MLSRRRTLSVLQAVSYFGFIEVRSQLRVVFEAAIDQRVVGAKGAEIARLSLPIRALNEGAAELQ